MKKSHPREVHSDSRLAEIHKILSNTDSFDVDGRSDTHAIIDGYIFQQRFGGLRSWPRPLRQQLIALKNALDLNDTEVRVFLFSGEIRRHKSEVIFSNPHVIYPVWGLCQIIFWIYLASIFMLAAYLGNHILLGFVVSFLACMTASGFIYLIYRLLIAPWFLQKQLLRGS
jgi:hypothetical protein